LRNELFYLVVPGTVTADEPLQVFEQHVVTEFFT